MKVVLVQNVSGLGVIDDIKEVSEGYARNFLFPRHLAVQASAAAQKGAADRQRRQTKEAQRTLQREQTLAGQLDGMEIEFSEKAGPAGQLYAAIGAQKVAEYLSGKGFALKKNNIGLPPIKAAGEHRATVKLGHGLEADLKIIVHAV